MEDYESGSQSSDEEISYDTDGYESYSDVEERSYLDEAYLDINDDMQDSVDVESDNHAVYLTPYGFRLDDTVNDYLESIDMELQIVDDLVQAEDLY